MNITEKTVYVAVFVVEHEVGKGVELDAAEPTEAAAGVRANFVTWLDVAVVERLAEVNEEQFYRVRDVTLYSERDFLLELRDHGTPSKFPAVELED